MLGDLIPITFALGKKNERSLGFYRWVNYSLGNSRKTIFTTGGSLLQSQSNDRKKVAGGTQTLLYI